MGWGSGRRVDGWPGSREGVIARQSSDSDDGVRGIISLPRYQFFGGASLAARPEEWAFEEDDGARRTVDENVSKDFFMASQFDPTSRDREVIQFSGRGTGGPRPTERPLAPDSTPGGSSLPGESMLGERQPSEQLPWWRGDGKWLVRSLGGALASGGLLFFFGSDGYTSVQLTPFVSTMMVVLLGLSLTVLPVTLARFAARWISGHLPGWPRVIVAVVAGAAYVLWEGFLALLGLLMLMFGGSVPVLPVTVNGHGYYEIAHCWLHCNYEYFRPVGPFLMERSGPNSFDESLADNADNADNADKDPDSLRTQNPTFPFSTGQPDPTVLPPEGGLSDPSGGGVSSAQLPVDPQHIVASETVGGVVLGIWQTDAVLGGRGAFSAVASTDGGKTWETRGPAGTDVSFYSYSVVDENIQVLGFGTGNDSRTPPALITYDGGWTWLPLELPFPGDLQPFGRFVESAERTADGTIVVVANYPDWEPNRGEGTRFTSTDNGVTWRLGE